MKFEVKSELVYEVKVPSVLILNIQALDTKSQHIMDESLSISPFIKTEELRSFNGLNRFLRIEATKDEQYKINYKALVDVQYQRFSLSQLEETNPGTLDPDVIPFLFPSRYAQSDKLGKLAYDMFGSIQGMHMKLNAIVDWIYNNVEYISGSTNSLTSAYDTVTERIGVCRDFAHLGIALCRALTIPARYFTGYSYLLNPSDFHACFEAYIGDRWILYDATRLAPLNGLIRIGSGRDAADAAVATLFGSTKLISIDVECTLKDANFQPLYNKDLPLEGISLG